jgi:hypothetical protein
MNPFFRTIISFATLATQFFTPSCKKDDDGSGGGACKLTGLSYTSNTSTPDITIAYNANGTFATVTSLYNSTTYVSSFIYSGNTITITTRDAGGILEGTDEVALNSNGNITSIVRKDHTNAVNYLASFLYDANGTLTSYTTQNIGSSTSTINTEFNNGDLTRETDDTYVTDYGYYTNPIQDGDYYRIVQMITYGAVYIRNAHLIKSIQQGANRTDYTYSFDSDGKITSVVQNYNNRIDTTYYSYTCQ